MLRRTLVVVLLSGWLAGNPDVAFGHAGTRSSDPEPGATLGDGPTVIRLSFTEAPDLSLSVVRVLDTAGAAYQAGGPQPVPGDPRSLILRVRPLDRGIYTVSWRIVSASDGHATEGGYSFGVRATPTAGVLIAGPATSSAPALEILSRSILILGLVMLLGVGAGYVVRFAGAGCFTLALAGWILAAAGLVLLAWVQLATTGGGLAPFLRASVGRALIARAIALTCAGAALLLAAARPQLMRVSMMALSGASLAAMGMHAAAGHAAAERGWRLATMVISQWAHLAAVGVWIGGLAALLISLRGAPTETKAAVVRRFSAVAASGLLVVVATGVVRSAGELSAWSDLLTDPYGRAVTAKAALAMAIAGCGAVNRWKNLPAAANSLRGLRITGAGEIALAGFALVAAAALGTIAPPRAGLGAPRELSACGVDAGTTVRVCVSAASDQPGANRFVVRATDYDSRQPAFARRVSLHFMSLEDPGLPPSSLALAPGPAGTFVATGANLAFAARWRITTLIEGPEDAAEVPIEVETAASPQFVSTLRVPGEPPEFSVLLPRSGQVQFKVYSERQGRSRIDLTFLNVIGDERAVDQLVLLAGVGRSGPRQQAVRRVGRGRFAADVHMRAGINKLTAIGRLVDGTRVRAVLEVRAT